jgi:hypothetical protein
MCFPRHPFLHVLTEKELLKLSSNNHHHTSYCYQIRNVFVLQDAAGGFLKKQADPAVLRGKFEIQSAKDFFHFATANLTRLVVPWHEKFRRNFLIILNSLKYYKQC